MREFKECRREGKNTTDRKKNQKPQPFKCKLKGRKIIRFVKFLLSLFESIGNFFFFLEIYFTVMHSWGLIVS